jgi:hypothetical protein
MLKKLELFGRMTVFGLFGLLFVGAGGATIMAQPASASSTAPSAKFDRVWVDYDVKENGVNGMRIHAKFTVYGMKNVPSYIAIYFEDINGVRLRDKNKKIYSSANEVAIYKALDIGYDPGVFDDVSVFMPYEELELAAGKYALRMDIDLIYKAGGLIQHLTFENFSFTQPEAVTSPTTTNEATVNKIWIEYDVTENGRKGMRVHADFKVYGLKGIDSYIAIYIQRENGDALKSNSTGYSSVDGTLALFKVLKPGFEPTLYEDAQLFLPYDEIPVGNGEFNLKLDIDLIYKNGDLFKHLDFKPFVFRRQR